MVSWLHTTPPMPAQRVSPSHQYALGKNVEVSPKPPLIHLNSFIRQVVLGIIPSVHSLLSLDLLFLLSQDLPFPLFSPTMSDYYIYIL